jgi:hypothetical protein
VSIPLHGTLTTLAMLIDKDVWESNNRWIRYTEQKFYDLFADALEAIYDTKF